MTADEPSTSATPAPRPVAPAWLAVAVILVALVLRLWHVGAVGISHWDAGSYTAGPLGVGPYAKREIVLFQTPPLVPAMFRELFEIFGTDERTAVVAIALFGTLTVALLALAGRRWIGAGPALVAAAALAGMEFHLLFSRQALTDVPFAFFFLLAAWAFTLAVEKGNFALFALAGLAADATLLTKYHGFLVLVLMGGWLVAARRKEKRAWTGWLLACALGAVAAVWLAVQIEHKLGLANFRASRKEWLNPIGLYLIPQTALLIGRCLWEWVSPFVLAPAAVGLVVMARRRSPGDLLALLWLALFLCALPFYRFYPRLLVPLLPPLALAAAVGLESIARRAGSRAGASETAVLAMLVLVPGAWSARASLSIADQGYGQAAALLNNGIPDPRPDLLVTQHSLLFYLRDARHPFIAYDEPEALAALERDDFRYLVADLRLIHAEEFRRFLEAHAADLKLVAMIGNPLPPSTIVNSAGFDGLDQVKTQTATAEQLSTLETIRIWRHAR